MLALIGVAVVMAVVIAAMYYAMPADAADANLPAIAPRKPHYLMAAGLGTVLGLLTLVAVGFLSTWNGTGWEIPPYIKQSELTARLWYQAAWLRTCHLALEQGLTFIVVPVSSCCGIAKLLTCLPRGSGRGRFLARTFWIYLCCAIVAFAAGCLAACFHIPSFVNEVVACLLWGFATAFLATLCGALPAVALLISLVAEGIRNNMPRAIEQK